MKQLMQAAVLGVLALSQAIAEPIAVEIRGEPGDYQLYRGGEPYRVLGAGTQQIPDFASLAAAGGNSIRTWDSNDPAVLDRAHELGLTVSLCLDIKRERHGFDYGDPVAVKAQFEKMKAEVLKYRDHPALLTWVIGNELNFDYTDSRVYDAVNDISKMIHELDPHHPTTTTTAGVSVELLDDIRRRAPDLDFVSVQFYGGLFDLPKILKEANFHQPIMVTEWGTVGHWEVPTTEWQAPLELNSSDKAEHYRESFEGVLQVLPQSVGDYVFLWGHKQERTPTWYGTFTPFGERTEAVDTMQYLWTGEWPENQAPHLVSMKIEGQSAEDNIRLKAGQSAEAIADVTDPDEDVLGYRWHLMAESQAKQVGGDTEAIPEDFSSLIQASDEARGERKIKFQVPGQAGAYRLFVYGADNAGGAAHANIPFYVVE